MTNTIKLRKKKSNSKRLTSKPYRLFSQPLKVLNPPGLQCFSVTLNYSKSCACFEIKTVVVKYLICLVVNNRHTISTLPTFGV